MNSVNIGRLTITHDFERDAERFFLESELTPLHHQYGLRIMWVHRHGTDEYSGESARAWIRKRYFANYYNISHLISGRGWLCLENGKKMDFSAGDGVLMLPGVIHDYSAYDHYFEDCLAFAGPLADHMAACGILKPGILHIGKLRRLLPVIELATSRENESQIKANLQLQNLLAELYFENQNQDKRGDYSMFSELLEIVRRNPGKWWTVAELAELASLSVNQFIRAFRAFSGSTPKNYIDTMKMNMAANELRNSNSTIESIARRFGYEDVYHFSRRFKRIVGLSPSHYRNALLIHPEE